MCADLGGCAVLAVGLPQLLFWDCWFEFRRGHGGLCLVKVMYCQVEVSVTGWLLDHRISIKCGVSVYDRETLAMRRPRQQEK